PQYTVGTRVLRADVEEHEIRYLTMALHSPVFRAEFQSGLFAVYFLVVQTEGSHFRCPCRMFFPQRMTFPRLRHQYPAKVRMAVELNTDHIIDLAFVPACVCPEIVNAGYRRQISFQRKLQLDEAVAVKGVQVIDKCEFC